MNGVSSWESTQKSARKFLALNSICLSISSSVFCLNCRNRDWQMKHQPPDWTQHWEWGGTWIAPCTAQTNRHFYLPAGLFFFRRHVFKPIRHIPDPLDTPHPSQNKEEILKVQFTLVRPPSYFFSCTWKLYLPGAVWALFTSNSSQNTIQIRMWLMEERKTIYTEFIVINLLVTNQDIWSQKPFSQG